jgi:endonuclease/exonuclease/phosphatase family metal-dependent hydrolase
VTIDSCGRYRFSSTKSKRSVAAHLAAAVLAAAVAGCASHHHATTAPPPQTCRDVVPDPEPLLLWISPTAIRDRHPLSDWCATVGPVLYYRRPPSDPPAFVDRLTVVTWNVHVGFGDVRELIRRLQSGTYTGGEGIQHFVLLLQEAYRRDGGVPARTSIRLRLPARVGARHLGKRGADIDRVVRDQRLSLLYVPSMRNGGDPDAPEDRGNAILSTLPLDSPAVIDLPFEHQRRAAALAVVEGRTRAGLGWRLGVVDVHFDTALALTRGGPLAARRRQAAALVEALAAAPDDTVLGGDFNTWLGSREPALKVMRRAFPEGNDRATTTWKGPLGLHASLDHLLARGRPRLVGVARLPDRLGSDHYPVMGIIEF